MLKHAYFLAKIFADTAENERHFAENLPKIGNYPKGPRPVISVRSSLGVLCPREGARRQRRLYVFVKFGRLLSSLSSLTFFSSD